MLAEVDMIVREGVEAILTDEEIVSICERVLVEENVSRSCFVSVSIVDDDEMRELNRSWRNQDRPTDVLSLECERPDDDDLAEGEPCELGDIVLAPNYIKHQAYGFNTTPADECRLLVVHGMLHLLGYDHILEEDALSMEAREDELLSLMATDAPVTSVRLTRHREVQDS